MVLHGRVWFLVMMAAVVRVARRLLRRRGRREGMRMRRMLGRRTRRVGLMLIGAWTRWRMLRRCGNRQRGPRVTVVGRVEARPLLFRQPGIHVGDICT